MTRSRTAMKTAKQEATESVASARKAVRAGLEAVREEVHGVEEGAREKVSGLRNDALRRADDLKQGARDRYETSVTRAREGYAHGRETMHSMTSQGTEYVREHPGAALLASFGVGLLLGFLIRGTARRGPVERF